LRNRYGTPSSAYIAPDDGKLHTLTGNFRRHERFHSNFLPNDRDVLVYLPPGYEDDRDRHYPVLYLQDGQNLFDGATSFIPGQDWHVDETAEWLIGTGTITPVIIVGIYNTGAFRMDEYTPTRDGRMGHGGQADFYALMLVEELKPYIDRTYRTQSDGSQTALGGSSLGGLVSLYIGLKHPDIFGKVAAISPAVWWDKRSIVRDVRRLAAKPDLKIWLDIGTAEGNRPDRTVADVRKLRDALERKGWKRDVDLAYFEDQGAGHNENAWASRVGSMLQFLFPNT
jgi:predicted alpha/beta superfamily hydrolase